MTISIPRSQFFLRCLHLFAFATLAAPAVVQAQTIPNPSFEANTFTAGEGFVSQNSSITGWTVSHTSRIGLNPASTSPFADNGAAPDGVNVAFLQSDSFAGTTLSTTITGLTPGTSYTIRFRANSRATGALPGGAVLVDGSVVAGIVADPVGGTNPYHWNSAVFTAAAANATLAIFNESQFDSALLVDDFSIELTPPEFSTTAWTGDASSGIDSANTYWAYHFGSTALATINGVDVPGINAVTATVPGRFTLDALTNAVADTNNLTSLGGNGSALIAGSYRTGGPVNTLELEGLTPGITYRLSLLSAGWGSPAGTRRTEFQINGGNAIANQEQFGTNNGIRFDHVFTPTASTYQVFANGNTDYPWHFYGISLTALSPEVFSPLVTTTNDTGLGSLRHAVFIAAPRSTITFAPELDGATIHLATSITVDAGKNLVIDAGNLPSGITIDDGNATTYRLFSIDPDATATMRDLTFAGNGAISNTGTLTLERCTLSNNAVGGTAFSFGGAISNSGTLTLTDCAFNFNLASTSGGALYNSGISTITGCSFSTNASINGDGGAIFSESGSLTVTECSFSNNRTFTGGGGAINIFNSSEVNLIDSTFTGNKATFGGAIYSSKNTLVTGCSFSANAALSDNLTNGSGGAIYTNAGTLTLNDNSLFDNSAVLSGGGIEVTDNATLILNDSTLRDNTTNGKGGGIYSKGTITLNGSTLAGNSADDDGGGIYNLRGTLTLNACTLSGNSAVDGGGIFNSGGGGIALVSLNSCTLANNSASDSGGGIQNSARSGGSNASVILSACTIVGNSAVNEGGGIFIDRFGATASLTLTNSIVADNSTQTAGSGPDIHNSFGTVSPNGVNLLSDTTFSSLTAGPNVIVSMDPKLSLLGDYGGSTQTLFPLQGSPAIDAAGITDPGGTDQRGLSRFLDGNGDSSVALDIGSVEFLRTTFIVGNTDSSGPGSLRQAIADALPGNYITFAAGLSGTTIPLDGTQLTIDKYLTIDASALPAGITIDAGGGSRVLELTPDISVYLHSLTLTGGLATNGGAIYNPGATLTASFCTISGNSADSGGGIYNSGISGDATMLLVSCTIADNSSSSGGGGGIYNINASLSLIACTLSGNSTNGLVGGAIYNVNASLSLEACTLSGNSAVRGGGIANLGQGSGNANLSLEACTLSGNSALDGGGIWNSGDNGTASLSLDACTLSGNSATSSGGGIYTMVFGTGNATLSVSACTISGNTAAIRGGGIHSSVSNTNTNLALHNTILAGNTAPSGPDLGEGSGFARTTLTGKNLISNTRGNNGLAPSSALIFGPAGLAPLGNYGGPVPTMHPLVISAAIDSAGGFNPGGTDQRGFARFSDGQLDIGAVEAGPAHIVTQNGDNAATSTTLRKALIEATAPGAVIRFSKADFNGQPSTAILLSNGELVIDNTVFIDASDILGGITIDADGASRIFQILPDNIVSLNGLTLTGGAALANLGGAIYADRATLTLNDCTISNSTAAIGGGILVVDCDFALNRCVVSGNSSTFESGGIYLEGGTSILTASTITGNTTLNDGAGLYVIDFAVCHLINSTIYDNIATSGSGQGGGIMTSSSAQLHLVNTTVANNTASTGGGIHQRQTNVVMTLDNSIVAENTGSHPNISGVVASHSGVNFIGDITGTSGLGTEGIDYLTGDPLLAPLGDNGGPVPTLHPQAGSPVINPPGAATTSPFSTDARGFPRVVAGALDIGAVESGQVFLVNHPGDDVATGTTLRKAIADATAPGAIIRFDPAVFNGEPADTIALSHGQFLLATTLTIDASDITGGVTIDAGDSSRIMEITPGNLIALRGLTLTGGLVSGGNPAGNGGAIYNDRSELHITDCTISGNSATGGGGIYLSAEYGTGTLSIANCTLTSNSAGAGGAIFSSVFSGSAVVDIVGTTLTLNSADSGGAIYSTGDSASLILYDCVLQDNSSNFDGAGVYNNGANGIATLRVDSCDFIGNTSARNGGGIYTRAAPGSVLDTTFSENSATSGGGIYNDATGASATSTLNITSSTFFKNTTTGGNGGGGIYNRGAGGGSATVNVESSLLSENSVERNGGGIYNVGIHGGSATMNIESSTLSGNLASNYGGGFYNEGDATLTLSACTVSGNSATFGGGGICSDGFGDFATLSLENTILADNASANGPDLWELETTTTPLGKNLLSNVAGSSLSPSDPALIIAAPNLAPLGDYGGPTQTQPPLPGSPAVDAAGTIDPGGTDQRGFPRFLNGALDIGAVEGPESPSLLILWPTDDDGDGIAYGVEYALGTNPEVFDLNNPANLTTPTFNGSGHPTFTFGRNGAADPNTIWLLSRSPDLSPDSFVELFRFYGPTTTKTDQLNVTSTVGATSISVTDTAPPGKAFYRFEAIYEDSEPD